jgi:pimeloyl-[acyl-carrier protein] methyl ester esterase
MLSLPVLKEIPLLHVDVYGDGPDFVLLHGWGMHGGIWADWAGELASHFRVWVVDLPGHGNSDYQGQDTLDSWASAVQDVVPENAWWLGWSLGGLVSMAALASQRKNIRGLVLLASTPCFVATRNWKPAVDAEVFGQFAQQLKTDIDRTLTRFLSLQVKGTDRSGEMLRKLRAVLKSRSIPDSDALHCGLRLLQESDMRHVLTEPVAPIYWLLGERDTLVPQEVQNSFPGIPSTLIEGAGHAPFLSHARRCSEQLDRWLLKGEKRVQHAAG